MTIISSAISRHLGVYQTLWWIIWRPLKRRRAVNDQTRRHEKWFFLVSELDLWTWFLWENCEYKEQEKGYTSLLGDKHRSQSPNRTSWDREKDLIFAAKCYGSSLLWVDPFHFRPFHWDLVEWYLFTHSALFRGLRLSTFCPSKCGMPNWPQWSQKPDFGGLGQFHRWILRQSQGEAGQGGAHLEGPRCLQLAWKKNFTNKIFLV